MNWKKIGFDYVIPEMYPGRKFYLKLRDERNEKIILNIPEGTQFLYIHYIDTTADDSKSQEDADLIELAYFDNECRRIGERQLEGNYFDLEARLGEIFIDIHGEPYTPTRTYARTKQMKIESY
jgi:hypothetical protein